MAYGQTAFTTYSAYREAEDDEHNRRMERAIRFGRAIDEKIFETFRHFGGGRRGVFLTAEYYLISEADVSHIIQGFPRVKKKGA